MNMFIVFEVTEDGLVQAHSRNKTYKTIRNAVEFGIREFGGEEPVVTEHGKGATATYNNSSYVIVNVGDVAEQRAQALVSNS